MFNYRLLIMPKISTDLTFPWFLVLDLRVYDQKATKSDDFSDTPTLLKSVDR